jgi:hypothetical protein
LVGQDFVEVPSQRQHLISHQNHLNHSTSFIIPSESTPCPSLYAFARSEQPL